MGERGTPGPCLGGTAEKSELRIFVFKISEFVNQVLETVTVSIPRNVHKALKVLMLISDFLKKIPIFWVLTLNYSCWNQCYT